MTIRPLQPWEGHGYRWDPDKQTTVWTECDPDTALMAVGTTCRGTGIEEVNTVVEVDDIVKLLAKSAYGRAAMADAIAKHARRERKGQLALRSLKALATT